MILIVDFGSQLAHLIGRRLRQLGVKTEYVHPEDALSEAKKLQPAGIIFSGGPASVYEPGAPTISKEIFEQGVPVLGVCYGWQLMAHLLDGEVKSGTKEYGNEEVLWNSKQPFGIKAKKSRVIMSHGDSVTKLPPGFEVIGSTSKVKFAAVQNKKQKFYAVQFHPEADHTQHGMEILRYFAAEVCGEMLEPLKIKPAEMIAKIKEQVGSEQVICAVSGGVDSTVAAALLAKAIGKQLIPVYVESGLMYVGNKELVQQLFTKIVPANLVVVEARDRFLKALKGVTDPEIKRKTIGKLYVDIFQEQAEKHPNVQWLGQGTIYSDVIESKGSKHASKIKSHHNVGGLPKNMKLKLIEPIRNFYKDEVREIGRLVGLPEEIIMQHPMPGPGHSINIRGEVTEKRLLQVQIANEIVIEEVKKAGLYRDVFECFAVMTGAFSTAVKGDGRAFAEVIAVRCIDTRDLMTVQWSHLPYEVLQTISSRIVNEVPDVSRVVYDITGKPPATVRWE